MGMCAKGSLNVKDGEMGFLVPTKCKDCDNCGSCISACPAKENDDDDDE